MANEEPLFWKVSRNEMRSLTLGQFATSLARVRTSLNCQARAYAIAALSADVHPSNELVALSRISYTSLSLREGSGCKYNITYIKKAGARANNESNFIESCHAPGVIRRLSVREMRADISHVGHCR